MASKTNRIINTTGGPQSDSKSNEKTGASRSPSTTETWFVSDVVARLPYGAPKEGSESPIPFFHMLERLKTTPREGWRVYGINGGESISDHMYRMALMTMFAPKSLAAKIDLAHCTKMALVHDMAEALVGDITPVQGVVKAEKNRRESTTMDYLTKNLLGNVSDGKAAEDIRAIWQEYEDSETLESLFVHDIDKVELLLQVVEYERANNCNTDFGKFTWVAGKILLPELKEWAKAIVEEREELWAGREHISYTAISDSDPFESTKIAKSLKRLEKSEG